MKRFYTEVDAAPVEGGWQVRLDGRGVKTALGKPQIVPSRNLAEALAAEWSAQGDEIDPAGFLLRDFADYSIDVVAPDQRGAVAGLLPYGETDTLCYRAEPGEPLHARQVAQWEPVLTACEHRYDIHFERVGGIVHRPQPEATLARISSVLAAQTPFSIAALHTLASLASSLVVALAALEPDAEADALWDAANLEEDWQAELWGKDALAEERRARRLASFRSALRFLRLARA